MRTLKRDLGSRFTGPLYFFSHCGHVGYNSPFSSSWLHVFVFFLHRPIEERWTSLACQSCQGMGSDLSNSGNSIFDEVKMRPYCILTLLIWKLWWSVLGIYNRIFFLLEELSAIIWKICTMPFIYLIVTFPFHVPSYHPEVPSASVWPGFPSSDGLASGCVQNTGRWRMERKVHEI